MVNDNGFDLKNLIPTENSVAPEAPILGTLPQLAEQQERPEIDVITLTNPRSLFAMLPTQMRQVVHATFHSPEYEEARTVYNLGREGELSRKVTPNKLDHALRYNLWSQYYKALETGQRVITMTTVFAGICTAMGFNDIIRTSRLFWLLLPPTNYTVMNRRAHERALDRLYQVLDKDPEDEKGNLDYKLIQLQLKIFAILDTRLNGPITHKHEVTTKNLHLGVSASEIQKLFKESQREAEDLGRQSTVLIESDFEKIHEVETKGHK